MSEIMFVEGLISEEDLAHYGTPRHSGRFAWGSGKNPYHHGASSPFGRLRERHVEKKKAKARAANLEKARKAKTDKAEYERKKAEAIKSGSARQIAPYIKDMSDDELRRVKNRLQLEAEFRNLVINEATAADPKVAARMAKAKRMTEYAKTGVDAYNVFATTYNAFSNDRELPVISNSGKKKKKK